MTASEADAIIYRKSHGITLQEATEKIRQKTDAKIRDVNFYLIYVEVETKLRPVAEERAKHRRRMP